MHQTNPEQERTRVQLGMEPSSRWEERGDAPSQNTSFATRLYSFRKKNSTPTSTSIFPGIVSLDVDNARRPVALRCLRGGIADDDQRVPVPFPRTWCNARATPTKTPGTCLVVHVEGIPLWRDGAAGHAKSLTLETPHDESGS